MQSGPESMPHLHRLDAMPHELLSLHAHELYRYLPGPTLLSLPGEKTPGLFLSVLLHGNEDTGWQVLRNLLLKYRDQQLPRSLLAFIGNVHAARDKRRKLDHQPDFNRIWDGGEHPECRVVEEVLAEARRTGLFCSIDIHNNTGLNPHYACINRLAPEFLHLARCFSRTVVYFVRPRGVQSIAFSSLCPALTLECGKPGDEYGVQRATSFVDEIMQMEELEHQVMPQHNMALFHTVASVRIPHQLSISFDGSPAQVVFIKGLENLNFEEIPPDTMLATVDPAVEQPFHVYAEDGQDLFQHYFRREGINLLTNVALMPSMLTPDIPIVKQDCLCYLMEPYRLEWGERQVHDFDHAWRRPE